MKKKGILLVLLLVVVGILTAGFVILNNKNKEKEAEKKRKEEEEESLISEEDGELLYSFDYEDMKQIAFTYNGDSYSFTKTDEIWVYDADPDFPIHQVYMEAKAAKLAKIYVEREIPATESSKADFGLEEPEVSVTLTLQDGQAYTFLMGNRNDTVGDYYMLDENTGKYYLRDGSFIVAFGDGFSIYDLAELEEMPVVSASEITHIYVNGEENKNMDNLPRVAALKFSAGVNYKASDEEMEQYGLAAPQKTLKVEYNKTLNSLTTEKSYTLLVGKEAEEKGENGESYYYVCLEGYREVNTMEASKLAFILE